MEENKDIQQESTGTGTGEKTEKRFSQEEVNQIVQERIAREKGKGDADLQKRTQELDKRERKMNAVQKLRDNGLPDYLADALNMETDEALEAGLEAVLRLKKESKTEEPRPVGRINPIGSVGRIGGFDPIREAFRLK